MRTLLLAGLFGLAFNALGQGLFDDNEARRRIELLRSQVAENQRLVDEQLKKLEAAMTDRGALLQISSQLDSLNAELAKMRGQLEVLANQAEVAERKQKDLYLSLIHI